MEPKVIGDAADITHLLPPRTYQSAWSSNESFARHIRAIDTSTVWAKDAWRDSDPEFYGLSMEEALKLAEDGWPEGVERVEKTRKRIEADHPQLKYHVKYGIAGSAPNVPRAIAGNPLNMKAQDLAKAKRKTTITLISDMCVAYYVDAKSLCNRAAVLAVLIDQIEAQGYACEVITAAMTNGDGNYSSAVSVRVKESGHPVDIKRLAYGLGHVSMFRRLTFADWYNEPSARDGLGRGLGRVEAIKVQPEFKEKNIFVVPSASNLGGFDSEEQASTKGLKNMISSLKSQGCPAFAEYVVADKVEKDPIAF